MQIPRLFIEGYLQKVIYRRLFIEGTQFSLKTSKFSNILKK